MWLHSSHAEELDENVDEEDAVDDAIDDEERLRAVGRRVEKRDFVAAAKSMCRHGSEGEQQPGQRS